MNALDDSTNLSRLRADERPRATELWLPLAALIAIGVALRLLVMPRPGLAGDLDQFVLWVHGLTTSPFGHAYDQNVSFPPVMVAIWGVLAALDPAFRTATSSADESVRILMKTPAVLGDLAIAGLIAFHLHRTPRWAFLAAALVLLHPAVIDVSAWWGQYESIFVLLGVVAFVLAVRGHSLWAAAALALALMAKPQALPFLVPFAAWFLARDGWVGATRATVVGAAVIAFVWLPFLGAGGVQHYLATVDQYQSGVYAILSLRAWNMWWVIQELLGGGSFVGDQSAVLGPLTFRQVGYVLALVAELAVFVMVFRARTPRALALGLAAAALIAFCLLTTMHERYAFAAIAFLPLAFPSRAVLVLTIAFGGVFTLNLLAAVPPLPEIGAALRVGGSLGIAGSVVMLAVLGATLELLRREARTAGRRSAEAATAPRPTVVLERAA